MSAFLNYELPSHLIAQQPASERDAARLMVLRRAKNQIANHGFRELPELLNAGDLLVLNDTRVLPARLVGRRDKTGGKWEGLFLREDVNGLWEMLCQTTGKPELGEAFTVDTGSLRMLLLDKADGLWQMEPLPHGAPADLLTQSGHMPLPPYIRKGKDEAADRERYQTVFARTDGSVAAPTAGLHFTRALFERLRERGIGWTRVTLHVGLGTFEPIRVADPLQHVMHPEWVDVPDRAIEAIRECKARGGRVIAVGTTATRALESAANSGLRPWRGETNLFIHPPYVFKVIDGLITNFHLPRTTLLLLAGAFAGTGLLQRAYAAAIASEYRFYSYGDAMLII